MSIELTERKTPKDRLLDRTGEAFAQDDQLHRLPQRRIRPTQRYWLQVARTTFPLWLSDTVVMVVACALGFLAAEFLSPRPLNHPFAYCAAAVLFQTLLFSTNGLYPAVGLHPAVELRHLVLSELQLAFVTVTYLGLVQDSWSSPYVIMASVSFLMAAGMIPIARSLTRSLVSRAAWWGYPTLLVGDRATCERVAQLFNRNGRQGFKPLGYFQDPDEYWSDSATETTEVPWLGPVSQVNEYARREQAYWLIISMPETLSPVMKSRFEDLRRRFPHVIVVDGRHDLPCLWNRAVDCGGIAAVKVEERLLMPEQQFSKRLLDLVLVTCALLVFAPLLAAITFVLWITNGRPIFYGARRIGRDGHEFMAWKFRSMVSNADQVLKQYLDAHPELRREFELDHKLKNDPRITRIGKILRRTSLDELPQLFNVLRGDMSLVGPRPIVTAEIAKYGEVYDLYLRVRPGISGMWQVSGRNDTSYEERVMYDSYYVRNWSPWLDLYILARTIKVVLRCEGAY